MSGRRTGWLAAGSGARGRSLGPAPGSPGHLARWSVRAAVQLLPRGGTRDRYREEFVAELFGMTPRRQLRHVVGIAASMPALNAVVRRAGRESWEALVGPRPRRRLRCATNIRHRWGTFSTEDGKRYRACVLCGKDYPVRDGRREDHDTSHTGLYGM